MQTKPQSIIFAAGKLILAGAALAGFLLFTGAPRLRADDDACQRRIARADHRLHDAIEHHGRESKQADKARHELHEARSVNFNNDICLNFSQARRASTAPLFFSSVTS